VASGGGCSHLTCHPIVQHRHHERRVTAAECRIMTYVYCSGTYQISELPKSNAGRLKIKFEPPSQFHSCIIPMNFQKANTVDDVGQIRGMVEPATRSQQKAFDSACLLNCATFNVVMCCAVETVSLCVTAGALPHFSPRGSACRLQHSISSTTLQRRAN
jgi:hypothetical protein